MAFGLEEALIPDRGTEQIPGSDGWQIPIVFFGSGGLDVDQLAQTSHNRPQPPGSNLQHVAVASDHLIEHRVHEDSQEQARDQSRHNHDGKGFLCVRADAC
jgi:hypothetical protein